MSMRLGIDVGTNSIGWALLDLDDNDQPKAIKDMGVRIFSDGRHPKTQVSLAVERREKRQSRRRLDRFHQRKKSLKNYLVSIGLFPTDFVDQEGLKSLAVFEYRVRALDHKLTSYELGRVLLHLNQKRGFQSGRKISTEDAKNKVTERIAQLRLEMARSGSRSYGEYLYQKIGAGLTAKATNETGIYPVRQLLKDEFTLIKEKQSSSGHALTEQQWTKIQEIIFFQRPLKKIENGPCSLYPELERGYKFLPSFEEFRLLSDLHNLRWLDEAMETCGATSAQIHEIFKSEKYVIGITGKRLKKLLNLPAETMFKGEKEKEIKIQGCLEGKKFFSVLGEAWESLSPLSKDRFAMAILAPDDQESVQKNIEIFKGDTQYSSLNLTSEQWSDLSKLTTGQSATQSFSSEALAMILKLSFDEQVSPLSIIFKLRENETKALAQVGKLEYYGKALSGRITKCTGIFLDINGDTKSSQPNIDSMEGQYGKIANPTVHVGLRQLEKVFNDIVDRYGIPKQVHVELARDLKLNKERKIELNRLNSENQRVNTHVKELIETQGFPITAFNMERARLWLEINTVPKRCVYSGREIGQDMIFSDELEVDHILPFKRTLDDGFGNKVLVFRAMNRIKKDRSPFEAWGLDSKYDEIILRVKNSLPEKKMYRFLENAMKNYHEQNSFIARQLTDTAYLAKVSHQYLATAVINPEKNVVVLPGRLTALIRRKLGLSKLISQTGENIKDRSDHRHHAVDALVAAITSRSLLMRAAEISGWDQNKDRTIVKIEEPWTGFYQSAEVSLNRIIVSHKVDHGIQGRFLKETALGLVAREAAAAHAANDVMFKTREFNSETLVKEISYEKVREELDKIGSIRSQVAMISHGRNKQHIKFYKKSEAHHVAFWSISEDAYAAYCSRNNLKIKKMSSTGLNRIIPVCVYLFDLNRFSHEYDKHFRPHPAAKLLLKLHKGDAVEIDDENGSRMCAMVNSISPANGNLSLETLTSQVVIGKKSFQPFWGLNPKKLHISPSGVVR